MPDSVRSHSTTESTDTSLSEFLAKRYRGTVPMFGGNPLTGARELGEAASADLVRAVSGLTGALNRFAGGSSHPASAFPPQASGPITMLDLSREITSIEDACRLDQEKIDLLLASSMIEPADTKRYATLLSNAMTALSRKRNAMMLQEQRRSARNTSKPVVELTDLDLDDTARQRLSKMSAATGIIITGDDVRTRMLLMAITHDSAFSGRETNRVLAHLGDSLLKVYVARRCLDTGRSVSDVSDMIQETQTDFHLANLARELKFDEFVHVAFGVDAQAKKIMATVLEAVVGAIYRCDGQSAVDQLITRLGVEQHTPKLTQLAPMIDDD